MTSSNDFGATRGRSNAGRALPWLALCLALGLAAPSGAAIFEKNGFKLYGDFRARLESDFDSRTPNGTPREDRTRIRVRARIGLDYNAGERLAFGLRLRSGSDDSQQSPHITVADLTGNDTGDVDFNLDKWFLKVEGGKLWGWIGRNSLPLWKQNEMVWDDDVTPAGLALGYRSGSVELGFEANAGYFSPPAGMRELAGNVGLAQAVFWKRGFRVAGALLDVDGDPADPDGALLLAGNGSRDYQIWVASLQARSGRWTFGVDAIHNAESYPASDRLRGDVDGFVGSLEFDTQKGWRAAYIYARIEAYAVNSSYAQDDWVRWGSATQTRASDLKGHELRFVKDLGGGQNLVMRLYLAEAITTVEDGTRFRVDWNVRF